MPVCRTACLMSSKRSASIFPRNEGRASAIPPLEDDLRLRIPNEHLSLSSARLRKDRGRALALPVTRFDVRSGCRSVRWMIAAPIVRSEKTQTASCSCHPPLHHGLVRHMSVLGNAEVSSAQKAKFGDRTLDLPYGRRAMQLSGARSPSRSPADGILAVSRPSRRASCL